jgi:hypothetical protein
MSTMEFLWVQHGVCRYSIHQPANGGFTPAKIFLDAVADASTVKVKMGGTSTLYLQENRPSGVHLNPSQWHEPTLFNIS